MNKYYRDGMEEGFMLESLLMQGETILWKDKPKKSAFIVNASAKMMPVAIIWLLFDSFFISTFVKTGGFSQMAFFLVPFFAIHLIPVWIWLSNVLTANKRWKNTEYAVTDKRVIIRNGLIGYNYQSVYYTDIANVMLEVGMIDSILKVGDIALLLNTGGAKGGTASILDIKEPQKVYAMLQKTVMDIQADIHYPNALRPDVNPGYNTQYRP